jgi:hypothetical protein
MIGQVITRQCIAPALLTQSIIDIDYKKVNKDEMMKELKIKQR